MSLKYYTSPVSASALFLDQSDLSIPLNSQSQVVRTRVAAVCSTLVADVEDVKKHFVEGAISTMNLCNFLGKNISWSPSYLYIVW